MWNEVMDALPPAGLAFGGIATAAFAIRHALSKLNLTTTNDTAQQALILNLQKEALKWQQLYDDTHKLLEVQRETNSLLRIQNAMMRQLLISKGLTENELAAIGSSLIEQSPHDH